MSEPIITTLGLTKRFGSFVAVNAIDLNVERGEIFGFLGANGAGKTTAMRMLCGLLEPTSGSATVAGYDLFTQTERIKRSIGYMSQKFSLYEDLTVMENIRFYGGIYGLSNADIKHKSASLIDRLGLHREANSLVRALPLGWKQKIAFSVSMLHDPQIVFLDEPTGGVDPITRRQFWDMIYEAADNGVTMFVTTHYMDEAEYCGRVSIMVDGTIAAMGRPYDLRTSMKARSMDDVFYMLARGATRGAD